MQVKLKGCLRGIMVGMSEAAFVEAWDRFSEYELVMRWEEFQGLALGVDALPDATGRLARMREGLSYFCERQGLTLE